MSEVKICLLTGYRKTGKDTFFNFIKHGKNKDFVYFILSNNDCETFLSNLFSNNSNVERISFADEIKKQVENYNEDNKELFREQLIQLSNEEKKKDENVWVKKAFETVETSSDNYYLVTDWRFKHEFDYTKEKFKNVKTMRIFRSNVEIPDENIESEHDLDSFKTDYVLLNNFQDYEKLIELFPQYTDYRYINSLQQK